MASGRGDLEGKLGVRLSTGSGRRKRFLWAAAAAVLPRDQNFGNLESGRLPGGCDARSTN